MAANCTTLTILLPDNSKLAQALVSRRPFGTDSLVHHSDPGSQYVSIKYTERLAKTGIDPSVGSVRDSYGNALAENINGLFKAQVIWRCGPWRSFEAVEFVILERVNWFSHRRLLALVGHVPPTEAEANYYAAKNQPHMAACLQPGRHRDLRRDS